MNEQPPMPPPLPSKAFCQARPLPTKPPPPPTRARACCTKPRATTTTAKIVVPLLPNGLWGEGLKDFEGTGLGQRPSHWLINIFCPHPDLELKA